ncbi:hypothetical protein DFH09DRAFT_1343353 [Mycena vulgaris]|nr:hypothetical protein DFH09DRAFT_1343353 [Mycena vulgaris]
MRMMQEWRHLVMLKRVGWGNDTERTVAETRPGELAVSCPACPQPGVNLPEDWEKAEGAKRFLYILFIAIDACFHLKRRLVSSVVKDPALGSRKEVSGRENGLAALDYVNTKFSHGYGATGVGLGVCARHEFVQKNGAGDLQKGERYANMDYIFASLMRHHDVRLLKYLSYDICCQWSKYLIERLKLLPPAIRLTLVIALVRFLIPKLHIYGHKMLCQLFFSLNYTQGSAQTDGEGIERPWANIGPVATSTREMGLGLRLDTLDNHCERNFQEELLATFTANQMEHVPTWKAMVEVFDADNTSPNPYELPKTGITEHDVRLQLVEEEVQEMTPIHNVSPSTFVLVGLDLEEQQRHVRIEAETRKDLSTKQTAEMLEKRTKLGCYMARFRTLQGVYTPLQALSEHPASPPGKEEEVAGHVENVPLYLPSALSEAQQVLGCFKGVVKIEERLCDAQCRSALEQIRSHLHVKSHFRTYKSGNARHQGATTRLRNLMNRNDGKIRLHAEKYVAAWEAKWRLVGTDLVGWRRLNPKKDLRCMDSEEDRAQRNARKVLGKKRAVGEKATAEDKEDGVGKGQRRKGKTGEGKHTISWIWMGTDTSSSATEKAILTGTYFFIAWAKAWARTKRWMEEVCWWASLPVGEGRTAEQTEGALAYAARQGDLLEWLAMSFEQLWDGLAEMEAVPGEVERRAEELAAERGDNDDDASDEEEDNEALDDGGEDRMEGDDEGSVGGDDDNPEDE